MSQFIAVVPGLRDAMNPEAFNAPQASFELIKEIAAQHDVPAYLLPYQIESEPLPIFSELGHRVVKGINDNLGLSGLQRYHNRKGIVLGNSVGGGAVMEATNWTIKSEEPETIILLGAVIGLQDKVMELFKRANNPAVIQCLNGGPALPVPIHGGGNVSIGYEHFADDNSIFGLAVQEEMIAQLKEKGVTDKAVLQNFRESAEAVRDLVGKELRDTRIITLAGADDIYCTPRNIADFLQQTSRTAEPGKTEVVTMPGGHGHDNDRPYLEEVIGAAIAKRPVNFDAMPKAPTA